MTELLVDEISVTIGVTREIGKYEFARIDITNRAKLGEPLDPDSKEYRMAHKRLVTRVEEMVLKAEAQIVPPKAE